MNAAIMTAIIAAGANNVNQNVKNDAPVGSGADLTLLESLFLLGCIGAFAAVMALIFYFMLRK